jgi:hypothetical protein
LFLSDLELAPIEALRGALAPMSHVGIGQTHNAVFRHALTDLRVARLIRRQVIAQNLGQQPSCRTHVWLIRLLQRQVQRRFRIPHQDLQLRRPRGRVGPVKVSLAVAVQIRGQVRRQPTLLGGQVIARHLQHAPDAFANQGVGILHRSGSVLGHRVYQDRDLVR